MYDGWRSLAAAIVLRACVDYVEALENNDYKLMKNCEAFFESSGLERLCGLDGKRILRLLRRQRGKAKQKIKLWEVLDALER